MTGVTGIRTDGATGLRRGQVAAAGQVNIETLRYCERRGCSTNRAGAPVGTSCARPRLWTVLRVIAAAQRLGFTLEEVAELLRRRPPRPPRGRAEELDAAAVRTPACSDGSAPSSPTLRNVSPI